MSQAGCRRLMAERPCVGNRWRSYEIVPLKRLSICLRLLYKLTQSYPTPSTCPPGCQHCWFASGRRTCCEYEGSRSLMSSVDSRYRFGMLQSIKFSTLRLSQRLMISTNIEPSPTTLRHEIIPTTQTDCTSPVLQRVMHVPKKIGRNTGHTEAFVRARDGCLMPRRSGMEKQT